MSRPSAAGVTNDAHGLLDELLSLGNLDLPVLPEVSAQLLRLSNDPNCEAPELAELIRRDQSLASHLLRIANSPLYASGSAIVSLQQAVARLGMRKIREIVVIISCQNRVFDVEGFEDEVRLSFRRSLGAAAFAQEVARTRRLNVEEAFLCGLLHDIGRPVLLQALVDLQSRRSLEPRRQDVLEAIEAHRAHVGSTLIESWRLPGRVAAAVRDQTLVASSDSNNQDSYILSLAVDLARYTLEPDSVTADEIRQHFAVPHLNLYPEQLNTIIGKQEDILNWVESTV